jgi:hypothetical protein
MTTGKGWLCLSEIDVPVAFPSALMPMLTAKILPSEVSNSILRGFRYTPQLAIKGGLVNMLADPENLIDAAIGMAENQIGEKDRLTYGRIKWELYKHLIPDLEASPVTTEVDSFVRLIQKHKAAAASN